MITEIFSTKVCSNMFVCETSWRLVAKSRALSYVSVQHFQYTKAMKLFLLWCDLFLYTKTNGWELASGMSADSHRYTWRILKIYGKRYHTIFFAFCENCFPCLYNFLILVQYVGSIIYITNKTSTLYERMEVYDHRNVFWTFRFNLTRNRYEFFLYVRRHIMWCACTNCRSTIILMCFERRNKVILIYFKSSAQFQDQAKVM